MGLPPVQGMPNCCFAWAKFLHCLGLPPVQGMPNSGQESLITKLRGLGLPPVQGMPNSPADSSGRPIGDCPPSKGCQTNQELWGRAKVWDCPRPRDAKLLTPLEVTAARLGLPPVQGMSNSRRLRQRHRAVWDCPRPRDAKLRQKAGSKVRQFGIAPCPRDAKLVEFITAIKGKFGIAPRPRDAKLQPLLFFGLRSVWDCPSSKGCQTWCLPRSVRALSFGIAPRPRDAKLFFFICLTCFVFGIAPRPRDAKLLRLNVPWHASVWDCPPSKGCQTRTRTRRDGPCVWDCPPSKGCQTTFRFFFCFR